jgi:predicted dehydrogenase
VNRLRAGLLGAGRIVREGHVPAYLANADLVDVVTVADPDPDRSAEVAAMLAPASAGRVDAGARDVESLLGRGDLDLVVVASPPSAHLPALVAAVRAGVAVVGEKPLCVDLEELRTLRAAGDGFVAVLHNYLDQPGWRHLAAQVRDGRIGVPLLARFEELSDDHWRLPDAPEASWRQHAQHGGGALRDNLYHALYLAEALIGSPFERVGGEQATLAHPYPGGDAAAVVARHRNGALTQALAAWCHRGPARATLELLGSEATVRWHYWAQPDRFEVSRGDRVEAVEVPGWTEADASGYSAAFRAILTSLLQGGPAPHGLDDAERVLAAIHQVPDNQPSGEARPGQPAVARRIEARGPDGAPAATARAASKKDR